MRLVRRELPDYQNLFEKHANDPHVAILTIDNDRNPDDVPPWMAQTKVHLPGPDRRPVRHRVGCHSFPTTWYLDREGRKVFEKVSWSQQLLEEFSWRIEAIRGTK